MKITKPYKAKMPEETVKYIKKLISESGLPVKEVILGDENMFFSCRISITRNDDTSIGTNGKGMNRQYAMASGYAEFMERFQNRVIVYPNPASESSICRFYPDESSFHWITNGEIVQNVMKFTPSTMPVEGIEFNELTGIQLPFYHVNSGEVVQIPYSLIRWVNGSNGMSAGNILEESLIQGFNEIFERYALQQMYLRNIVPPNVPISEFEDAVILERLRRIKTDYGMDFEIKDLSLDEGFPVLGLLIYNSERTKYILQLGADLNPEIALERCFTEIFQGYTANTLCFENDVNQCERLDLFNEFKRSLTYGRGRLPQSFFTETPSYEYSGHTTIEIGCNFKEDISNICRWVMDKGYDIYIRDNSFLGFKTTHIVVPGMSDIDHTFCRLNRRIHHMNLIENQRNPLFNLRNQDDQRCIITAQYLESLDGSTIDMFTQNIHPSNHVNRHLLLMMLYIKAGHMELARQKIEEYCEDCHSQSKKPKPLMLALLNKLGGDAGTIVNEQLQHVATKLLQNPKQIFNSIDVPECFNCGQCQIADGCRYPLLKEIENITQKAMNRYDFNQNIFSTIFA